MTASILIRAIKNCTFTTKLLKNFPRASTANKLSLTWLTNTTELAPIAAPKAPNIGRGLTGWGVGMEALGFPEEIKKKPELYNQETKNFTFIKRQFFALILQISMNLFRLILTEMQL